MLISGKRWRRSYEEVYLSACLEIRDSGLGLRRSGHLAWPTAIASSVQSHAATQKLFSSDFVDILPSTLMNHFDVRLNIMNSKFIVKFSPTGALHAQQIIDERISDFSDKLLDLKQGRISSSPSRVDNNLLINIPGSENSERLDEFPHLQHELCALFDDSSVDQLFLALQRKVQ